MKNTRTLNGYVVVYAPNHPKAMQSHNWKGYVYEHILIAEEDYGRNLLENEEVHHLDLNRSNNRPSNLIILSKKSHKRLHGWIENGATIVKTIDGIPINSEEPKCKRCKTCNKPLKLQQRYYCSTDCLKSGTKSKLDEIPILEILEKLSKRSMVSVAKDYNISDNGLRKYLKVKHNLDKATLSQALSTLKEGAETTGEV